MTVLCNMPKLTCLEETRQNWLGLECLAVSRDVKHGATLRNVFKATNLILDYSVRVVKKNMYFSFLSLLT